MAALVKITDSSAQGNLGVIWANQTNPVIVDSTAGHVPILEMDQGNMPMGVALPNPGFLKWRLSDVDLSTTQYDGVNSRENRTMELRIQTSIDSTTWSDYETRNLTMLNGMTGRSRYFLDLAFVPWYVRVTAKIWGRRDGTHAQASILMGMENMVL